MIQITDLAVFVPFGTRRYLVLDRDDVPPNRIRGFSPPKGAVKPLHRRSAPSMKAACIIARQERHRTAAIQAREAEGRVGPDKSMIEFIARLLLGGTTTP